MSLRPVHEDRAQESRVDIQLTPLIDMVFICWCLWFLSRILRGQKEFK